MHDSTQANTMADPIENQLTSQRVSIYIPSFGTGGVERMLVNLALGLTQLGIDVDFILNTLDAPYLDGLPEKVTVRPLGTSDSGKQLNWLVSYLKERQPSVLISAKTADDEIAMRARELCNSRTRIFLRPGTNLSERMRGQRYRFMKNWRDRRRLRKLFLAADGIVTVSQGVADDVMRISGIPGDKVSVIPNPTVTPKIRELAREEAPHRWLTQQTPVLIGIGRFSRAKDFSVLIQAFALVLQKQKCRLIILGDGNRAEKLRRLAKSLGIEDAVDFPGFCSNPYAYLARASLFVLSSRREGSPNALIEALALGVPVVATDCNSGPAEILEQGKYGPLVPVGDPVRLADAMIRVLNNPPEASFLKQATREYDYEISARRYLQAFGLPTPEQPLGKT